MLFESSKRKNDMLPNRWRPLMLISVILIGGVLVYALTRRSHTPYPDAPLVYLLASGERLAINLQTGERFPTNSSGIYTGDPSVLPGGKWRISGWRFDDYESYEPEAPLALQSRENPDVFLDTGRLAWHYSVTWTPDSQWIAFPSRRANCHPESKAGQLTHLPATPRPKADYCIDLASYDPSEIPEVWLANLQTGEAFAITENNANEGNILFSPRQPQLIYSSKEGLFLYDVSTRQTNLLFSGRPVRDAYWSPDAQWVAFTAGGDEMTSDLYVIQANGSGLQQIATSVRSYDSHWSP